MVIYDFPLTTHRHGYQRIPTRKGFFTPELMLEIPIFKISKSARTCDPRLEGAGSYLLGYHRFYVRRYFYIHLNIKQKRWTYVE